MAYDKLHMDLFMVLRGRRYYRGDTGMTDLDLLAAIRDLHAAIAELIDELKRHRQADQAGIETIVALHQGPGTGEEIHREQGELYG